MKKLMIILMMTVLMSCFALATVDTTGLTYTNLQAVANGRGFNITLNHNISAVNISKQSNCAATRCWVQTQDPNTIIANGTFSGDLCELNGSFMDSSNNYFLGVDNFGAVFNNYYVGWSPPLNRVNINYIKGIDITYGATPAISNSNVFCITSFGSENATATPTVPDPTMNSVRATPNNPFSTEDLAGYCNGTSQNASEYYVAYDWVWYVDGNIYDYNVNKNYTYQETANVSAGFGTTGDGSYLYPFPDESVPDNNCSYNQSTFDGDWNIGSGINCENPIAVAVSATYYVNYTIPTHLQSALLQQKTSACFGNINTTNTTIPHVCLTDDILQLKFVGYSASTQKYGKWYCFNSVDWEEITGNTCEVLQGDATILYEEAIFWKNKVNSTYYPSNQEVNVANVSYLDTMNGETWWLNCSAYANGTYSDWAKSNVLTITDPSVDNCSTYTHPILNLSYYDEITDAAITTDIGYDLNFVSDDFSVLYNGTANANYADKFCTNIDPSDRNVTWDVTGQITLIKADYGTRLFDITSADPFTGNNDVTVQQKMYLIKLTNSTTVTHTWLTSSYAPISGTWLIYRCLGDGSRTLVSSVPITDGIGTANIELLNIPYSYELVIDGVLYTDSDSYSKCHIESAETRQWIVGVGETDLPPVTGLLEIQCNITKTGVDTVKMSWSDNPESSSTIIGCLYADRNSVSGYTNFYTACVNTSNSIERTISNSGFVYDIHGKLFQNGYSIPCNQHITFNFQSAGSKAWGMIGIFSVVILIVGLVLLFAGDSQKQMIGASIAIVIAWIVGLVPFGWGTISIILGIFIIIALIVRFARTK